jgi:hypothetical protein
VGDERTVVNGGNGKNKVRTWRVVIVGVIAQRIVLKTIQTIGGGIKYGTNKQRRDRRWMESKASADGPFGSTVGRWFKDARRAPTVTLHGKGVVYVYFCWIPTQHD